MGRHSASPSAAVLPAIEPDVLTPADVFPASSGAAASAGIIELRPRPSEIVLTEVPFRAFAVVRRPCAVTAAMLVEAAGRAPGAQLRCPVRRAVVHLPQGASDALNGIVTSQPLPPLPLAVQQALSVSASPRLAELGGAPSRPAVDSRRDFRSENSAGDGESERVPSRFAPSSRKAPSQRCWPRTIRAFVAFAAISTFMTAGVPAYAADPAEVRIISPTTVVAMPQSQDSQDSAGVASTAAALSRTVGSVDTVAQAAPDSETLTAACAIDGVDMSGSVVFPLPSGSYHLSSGIGYRYISSLGRYDYHTGQDLAAPLGTSIFAVVDGTVVDIAQTSGAYYVEVRSTLPDGETIDAYYVHMYSDGIFVNVGDTVYAGQKIAQVGSSGISTGAHLHLELHDASNGPSVVADTSTLIDPLTWLAAHDAVAVGSC